MAFGINDLGAVVGTSTLADGSYVPFLYQNGVMTQLGSGGSGGGLAEAMAINNNGQIVGIGITPSGAFLYQNGSFIDLGTLGGGSQSQAYAINNLGQVVGFSHTSGNARHAFLYQNGVMNDLDPANSWPDSWAMGINDNGAVVGQISDQNGMPLAFLYIPGNGIVNLNNYITNLSNGTTIGFTGAFVAYAINKNGDIVGAGNYFNGTKTIQAGFLLKKQ
jgi:probable HAF family extracellular repeat protein